MGVTGLWPILAPTARPTELATLNRKRLAVDASIWIYQFLKAVRDKEGNALRNSHVVGFFRRICKLLFFGIKPVFVFDGGAPVLKRQTILGRKRRREGRREDAVRTAGRMLAVQMKRRGEEEEEKRKKDNKRREEGLRVDVDEEEFIPATAQLVYVGEEGMTAQERQQTRKFRKTDAYHLPDLTNGIEGMGQPNDPRIMSQDELEEYAKQFHNGEDVNLYDFSKIDFDGDFFVSLPVGDRYNILNAARLRSRLRMGLGKEQLEEMFPDRMEFSKFQIQRVRERNELTQRLMNLNGMNDLPGVGGGRIAGERGREYVLVKNDGVEGGWALGVVSGEKGVGDRNKPIDVDAYYEIPKETVETETEDEFEDVPVEGLNRLPQIKDTREQTQRYNDFQAHETADQRRINYPSRDGEGPKRARFASEEPGSLFVDADPMEGSSKTTGYAYDNDDDEDEDLRKAIAMSLQKDDDVDTLNDEEHLDRAVALSNSTNLRLESDSEDNADFEDVKIPRYQQRVVDNAKPITSSSGGMIAHIFNNRASAAVQNPKSIAVVVESDSDSDMDLQSALAKARKQKAPETRQQPAAVPSNSRNPFDGPLPFERLNFGKSIFGKKAEESNTTMGPFEEEDAEQDLEGGFEKEPEDEAPRPLPPWLVGGGDIVSDFEKQRERDLELNAQDREVALEEERNYRKKYAPIQIESSDSEDDFEIVDPPPQPTEKVGRIFEKPRDEPQVPDIANDEQPTEDLITIEQDGVVYEVQESDEEVDWSESDHGETVTKPAKIVGGEKVTTQSKSPSPEFEDVEMPQARGESPVQRSSLSARAQSPVSKVVDMVDVVSEVAPELTSTSQHPLLMSEDAFDRQQAEFEDAEFDDFSDPEDEELLAQLAIEAEEHARFASTLNPLANTQESQEAYEKELKALRNQQKKDRRDADEVSHVMITECQALLRLFGLPYITAPMEAEAQCAELVRLELVDGVVTDDCDIFLFGGTRVYKNMFNSNKFVECYIASDIEKDLSLSRDQLISIAQLLGSDYAEGLPGVGPVTAVEILSEFPTSDGLSEFKDWWSAVQLNSSAPISSEPTTFRKKFRRSQGTKLFLPPGFPSPAVAEAYLKPDVDSTPEPFQWGVPDLDRLRDFLMETIGWTQERTDEILVPVIRDMNRREQEGTQSNITRFFKGAVGAGGSQGRDKDVGSKRMKEAVGRLKAKRKAAPVGPLDRNFGEEAAEWAKHNDLSWTEREQEKFAKKGGRNAKGKGKGKEKRKAPIAVDEDADVDADVDDIDGDDYGQSADEYQDINSNGADKEGNARLKGKEIVPSKRKRAKV